jgi:hypothetical protein
LTGVVSPLQSRLAGRLQLLRECAGIGGRDVPGAGPFCE